MLPSRIDASYFPPVFPTSGSGGRGSVRVVMNVLVYEDGSVGNIEVLDANGAQTGDFARTAENVVRMWRYRPARKNGCPTAAQVTVVSEFQLRTM